MFRRGYFWEFYYWSAYCNILFELQSIAWKPYLKNYNIRLYLWGYFFSPFSFLGIGFWFYSRKLLWHYFYSYLNILSATFVLYCAEVLNLALFCCEFPKLSGSGSLAAALENILCCFSLYCAYWVAAIMEFSEGLFEKTRCYLSWSTARSSYSPTYFSMVFDILLSRSISLKSYFEVNFAS